MPDAILFDLDGTLFDTEPLHHRGLAEVLAPRGIVLGRALYDRRYLGLGTDRDAVRQIVRDFHRPELTAEIDAIVADKARVVALLLEDDLPLYEGAADFVAAAARRSPLAIVSGARRSEIEGLLTRSGLARFFGVIVAAEDVQTGKPDPEGYRRALGELEHRAGSTLSPERCLAIEDSPNGVAAARAVGLRVLALTHTRPREALTGADVVAASYADVRWPDLEALVD